MSFSGKATWRIATTYIGTVVGAGFASGQEVLRFFSGQGFSGVYGVLISTILFVIGGTLLLFIGYSMKFVSFREVLCYVCGNKLGKLLEFLLTLCLFGTLSVMLAGSAAVLMQQLHIPHALGVLITVGLTIFTLFYGMKGIINANGIVVPLLTVGCLVVGLSSIHPTLLFSGNLPPSTFTSKILFNPHWSLAALTYVAYNLSLSVGVLAPLGNEAKSVKALLWGGILGGLLLGLLASIINLSILSNMNAVFNLEIPMLKLADRLGTVFQVFYALILWAEIYTTIIGNAYSITTNIAEKFNLTYKKTLILVMLLSIFFSQMGFSTLVSILYPLFGYVSLIFLAGLFSKPFRN